MSFVVLYICLKSDSCYFKKFNSIPVVFIDLWHSNKGESFLMLSSSLWPPLRHGVVAIEKRAFGSPSTEVANFTKLLISSVTVHEHAESKNGLPSVSFTRLDNSILELVINVRWWESTLNKDRCTWSESTTVLISLLELKLV